MGLRPSSLVKPKISMTWVLKGDHSTEPLRPPSQTKNREPSDGPKNPDLTTIDGGRRREKRSHPRRPRRPRSKAHNPSRFGYEITDVDAFLSKASLDNPGNIPVVLSSPCLLYQTRLGGHQEELSLPLGMVVNAVFKNQGWLYVQTPHGEEGYVRYAACLPLGILPPRTPAPCWETHTDIFPMPLGNRTDVDKVRSECGGVRTKKHDGRDTMSACGERSVDKLYLRATSARARAGAAATTRHTLLVCSSDYEARGRSTLTVSKGDVVALISGHVKDWFYVKDRQGQEGFIPAAVAGHGFL
ncbi:uncharacterized protein LOC128983491 isoform X1 [Macrosteles quadrilineatus]|uniref:uncharacterized protein LOC128983491 isoform X1 n=1 Tax=Macrosteles quadrilineatus TaxID=74068 RepID=UPI0023E2B217|nr:uncharacterized protein LOC128983491 isoform X1 [Macrosteles quadrilineatus]